MSAPQATETERLSRPSRWPTAAAAACVILAALAAYYNSFSGPFIFDDLSAIVANPAIQHISGSLLPAQGGLTTSGRPVLSLSFALNHATAGSSPAGYHVTNFLIHTLAGLTLYGLVRRTLRQPKLGARFGASALPLALAIAVIWTVHPLQTESVTYIVQRAESLMGLCFLTTLYCHIRWMEDPGLTRWAVLSFLICLAGMAVKEVMISAPLVVLLYDRTFVAGTFREAWRRRGKYYLSLAGTWVLLALLIASTGSRGGTMALGVGAAWWAYPLTQFQAIVRYLCLAVWPYPLVLDYGTHWVMQLSEVAPYALILVPLTGMTLYTLWRHPPIGFLGAWFFVILAPTSLAPGTIQMTVEHRMYLPLAAVITAGVLAVHHGLGARGGPILIAIALAGLTLTALRNVDYRSAIGIWSDTVAKRPANALAHNNLGLLLQESGRISEAIVHYQRALQLEPNSPEAHNNLGEALRDSGRTIEATAEFEAALRLRPKYAEAHNNFGVTLRQSGQPEQAVAHYRQALQLKPEYPEAHNNLGGAFQKLGRIPEAMAEFELALRFRPEFAEAHSNLAVALRESGQPEKAIAHFEQALRIKPDYAEVHFNLALLLLELGKKPEARSHYEIARRLRPDIPEIVF